MQISLRVCTAAGVSLVAAAAIALGPTSVLPDDVVVTQRFVEVDPTALDTDIAGLYRAVVREGQDSAGAGGQQAERPPTDAPHTPDISGLRASEVDTAGPETTPDGVPRVLSRLALGSSNEHEQRTVPREKPAISDGQSLAGAEVTDLREAVAEADPNSLPTPTSSDELLGSMAITQGEASVPSPEPVLNSSAPGASSAAGASISEADRDTVKTAPPIDPAVGLAPDAAESSAPLDRQALLPMLLDSVDSADPDAADRPTISRPSRPRTENVREAAEKAAEKAADTLRDVGRALRQAVDSVRPQQRAKVDTDE